MLPFFLAGKNDISNFLYTVRIEVCFVDDVKKLFLADNADNGPPY